MKIRIKDENKQYIEVDKKKTKNNSLYLVLAFEFFDAILSGEKKEEYRELKLSTAKKYLTNKIEDGVRCFMYDPDEISEENLEKYGNDLMFYNNGVFPYVPKDTYFLDLARGYESVENRSTMTVVVEDITFEPFKDKKGNHLRFSDNGEEIIEDPNGDLTRWQIVYHLGEIVDKNICHV